MRTKLSMLLALALLVTSAFGLAGPAQAHPITLGPGGITQSTSDLEWKNFGVYDGNTFSESNVGRIVRNTQRQGEYAWQDVNAPTVIASDARLISGATLTQTRQLDIRQFRMTGDATNLYVYTELVQVSSLGVQTRPAEKQELPQLQVAIDTDGSASGNATFVSPANNVTQIANKWERLIRTQFDSNEAAVDDIGTKTNEVVALVYTNPTTFTPEGASVLSLNGNAIELSIPWTSLGGKPSPSTPWRFSVATLRTNGAVPGDGVTDTNPSNIVDVVSRVVNNTVAGGDPTDTVAAISTNGGATLDYSAQVSFDANGEPYSPLLITELVPRPKGSGSAANEAQWFEVSNTGSTPLNLGSYKGGDAGDPGGNEGMYSLPNVTLASNQSIVLTRNRLFFRSAYPNSAFPGLLNNTYELTTTQSIVGDPAANTLAQYPGWGGLDFQLRTNLVGANGKDQVLLLDGSDTIIDLLEFVGPDATNKYPENDPIIIPLVGSATTIDPNLDFTRCPASLDTNSAPTDFVVLSNSVQSQALQTPGTPTCSIADVYTSVSGPGGVVVDALNATTANYTVTYGNNRADVVGATIAITLPRAMTLVTAASTPDIGQPAVSTSTDGRVLLTWSSVASAFGAQGTINLALQVPAGTNPNPPTDLRATFKVGTGTTDSNTANNTTSYPITYSAQPFADVGVSITNKSASEFFPGGKLVYGVTVTNAGPKQADNVTVEIDVQDFLTYKSNNQNYTASVSGNKVTLNLGSVAAGSPSVTTLLIDVEFTVSVNVAVGTTAQGTATVKTTTTPETPTTNNTSATSVIPVANPPDAPNVKITKALKTTGTVKPGDVVTYILTVSNVGTQPVAANLITAIDDFPETQLDYVGYRSAGAVTEFPLANVVRYTLNAPLTKKGDAGDIVTIEVSFQVKGSVANGTKITNLVSVPRVSGESTDGDNSASADLSLSTPPPATTYSAYLPLVVK